MNCLCCNKPINSDNKEEMNSGWHTNCVKKFFGTALLPDIEISDDILEHLATESTSKGYTVTGVQKKISLHLSDETGTKPRLTLVNYPSGYILKPQTKEYRNLPEAEYLVMKAAEKSGIKTVPFALIKTNGNFAYITKRIDRIIEKTSVKMLAMEDFCQLSGRLTEDKYKGSYERCGKIISQYSSKPGLDMSELFMRIVFSFIMGNSDMHLKNFSLTETSEKSGIYSLSKAYDLLPVNIVNPEDTEQFALTMNGKKRNIHRGDFIKFAVSCNIEKNTAEKIINKFIKNRAMYIEECKNSYLNEDLKENLIKLTEERISALS